MVAPFGIRPKGTLSARMLPLARELGVLGHQVAIVAPAYLNPEDAATTVTIDGVVVEHVPLPHLPGPLGVAEEAIVLVQAAVRRQPDLLHVFKPKGYSGLAALLAMLVSPRVPLVQDTDDWEGWGGWNDLLPYSQVQKTFFAWQERTLPRWATATTVASRTLQTQVWDFGVAPDRVWYVPNGVSAQPPTLPVRAAARRALHLNDDPVVLLYTRFWEYDLRDIVAVLLALKHRRPDARLLVLGAGERGEERTLTSLAQRAGVAPWLDMRGWADAQLIQNAFAAADVALAPFSDTLMNRAKGMAKLLELLHAGVPVVASRVGQAQEYIVDGVTGVLVPPDNGGALAQAVLALLDDPARARAIGHAGQRFVIAHVAWPHLAHTLEHVYRSVLFPPR
jgi:glycosyltransferase involved in cell wall biosynthesis